MLLNLSMKVFILKSDKAFLKSLQDDYDAKISNLKDRLEVETNELLESYLMNKSKFVQSLCFQQVEVKIKIEKTREIIHKLYLRA